jgi:hypothetical protein
MLNKNSNNNLADIVETERKTPPPAPPHKGGEKETRCIAFLLSLFSTRLPALFLLTALLQKKFVKFVIILLFLSDE